MSDLNPYQLGATPSAYGSADTYQQRDSYVYRAIDEKLAVAMRSGRLVILIGPSKVGKTRTAFEVLSRHEDWGTALLAAPVPQSVGTLAGHPALGGGGRLVIWLDDLQRFLPPGGLLSQAMISRLIARSGPTLLLSTLRTEQRSLLRGPAGDMAREVRMVLDSATVIELASTLDDPSEQERAVTTYQIGLHGTGLAEMLAGAPELLGIYHDSVSADPVLHALVQSCIDWVRCGLTRPVPRSDLFVLAGVVLNETRPDLDTVPTGDMSHALGRARTRIAPTSEVALLHTRFIAGEDTGNVIQNPM